MAAPAAHPGSILVVDRVAVHLASYTRVSVDVAARHVADVDHRVVSMTHLTRVDVVDVRRALQTRNGSDLLGAKGRVVSWFKDLRIRTERAFHSRGRAEGHTCTVKNDGVGSGSASAQ